MYFASGFEIGVLNLKFGMKIEIERGLEIKIGLEINLLIFLANYEHLVKFLAISEHFQILIDSIQHLPDLISLSFL